MDYKVLSIQDVVSFQRDHDVHFACDVSFGDKWVIGKLQTFTDKKAELHIISGHPTKGAADKVFRKLSKDGLPEDNSDRPYQLSLTEKQAQVLVDALDLYSRIGMGQLTEVAHILRMNVIGNPSGTVDALDAVERLTREAASLWMGGSGGYYGITSEKISDVFRVSWDLQQVIRYRLAWDRNPKGGIQVHFDEPMKSSEEPMAIIKKV